MADQHRVALWGGFECSVVRLGAIYRDQCAETGHADRLEDIDRAHALGLRTLRYPALWETIAPDDPESCDWRWHDARFERLGRLGMEPIVGLLHHGSGPRYTDLLDPAFPDLLARHAERVARRYPWVEAFTPVNEPLTTARFSALYGHWYPHRTDMAAFLRATVGQCLATLRAMRAIRRVTPLARLIQTEDIGKVFSTPALAGQAGFENQRRWLTLDLLCGRVDRHHPWWTLLTRHGIAEADLAALSEGGATPDIIGVNHYLTSERFLDDDWRRYPAQHRGGNGRQDYADVEAVRVPLPPGDLGPRARLAEVAARYGRPVAVTEVHHGCSREEQLRWLADVWEAATDLGAEGVDVRAVTVWSLAGAVDWNSLLVSRRGAYEAGAFDIRAPAPRRTALGQAAAALARSGRFAHPALGPGWWRRPERLYGAGPAGRPAPGRAERPLLILGRAARLARAFGRICALRGLPHAIAPGGGDGLAGRLDALRPWAVLDLDAFEGRPELAAAEALAGTAARRGIALVSLSSAAVFDGRLARPYRESDVPTPSDPAGIRALDRERRVLSLHPAAIVARTGPVIGLSAWGGGADVALAGAAPGPGSLVSPAYLPDLAHAVLDLIIDGESGLWHLVNGGAVRWSEVVPRLPRAMPDAFPGTAPDAPGAPDRTLALDSEKAWIMPTLEDALGRLAGDAPRRGRAAAGRMAAE